MALALTYYSSRLISFAKFNSLTLNQLTRNISCTQVKNGIFHEKDPKSGYANLEKRKDRLQTQAIRDGLKELKHEIELWRNEVSERFQMDPTLLNRPGETDVVWRFGTKESLDLWVTTSDKDHNEGYSNCTLTLNSYGQGVFSGELCTRIPKDGRVQRAGYCSMRSIRARKSFKRDSYLDWTMYNVLVMKVRGDGRSYMLNIATTGYFDVMWNDVYNYILFTRGGPYWQKVKIPFSKFFFSSKGRIQDRQGPLPLHRVTNFGFTAGDKINGPFCLEIDYVGLEFDPNITEQFAYEMYKTDKYIVAT